MTAVNEDVIKGKWRQIKGDVRTQWGKLTDDDLDVIDGNREKLLGRIQENYGIARGEAEKQLQDWEKKFVA
ncbi:MAG: CsbD family protein [Alphaproteobacteria bacterium]|nr:CsbD family protein [Alphaproteobacteria bacterium]MBU0859376.1 CsbD family protein [Alphaproteobacteria bacterium]